VRAALTKYVTQLLQKYFAKYFTVQETAKADMKVGNAPYHHRGFSTESLPSTMIFSRA